jgi:protein-S-isoprenylcysteine O-methyltransferase Ste14
MLLENPWVTVYVIAILIFRFVSQSQRRMRRKPFSQWGSILGDPTAIVTVITVALGIGAAVVEGVSQPDHMVQLYLRLGGLVLLLFSSAIAFMANREIGANWSPSIKKTEDQTLVTTGIYAMIRHPLYLSGLILLIGTNIYFGCRWAWLGVALMILVILLRIPFEEKRLEERFGEAYRAYKQHTKAIIPWLY